MTAEVTGVIEQVKPFREEAKRFVDTKFQGRDKRDVVFLLTLASMARDALKDRQRINDFFDYAVEHQDEVLSLARQLDETITALNVTTGDKPIDSSHINSLAVRNERKLGRDGILPLFLGEGVVKPKQAIQELEAAAGAFRDQNKYMRDREEASGDNEKLQKVYDSGEWSELHINAISGRHFLATFMIDLYPMMLRRTGMYGEDLDTDEFVRALCENLDPKSEFFKLIKEQGWFVEGEFSKEFVEKANSPV